MEEFNKCIDTYVVVELKLFGGSMTWTNGQADRNRKWGKLDRALVNLPFLHSFNQVNVDYLAQKSSNHKPMLLSLAYLTCRYNPIPFRYQNMWSTYENFLVFMRQVWMKLVQGADLRSVGYQAKRSKIALKAQNKIVFNCVDHTISKLEERIAQMEQTLQHNYSVEVEQEFILTRNELVCWEQIEEIRVGQLVKKKWLQEGDENSKFFHVVVNTRRHHSLIDTIQLHGGTILYQRKFMKVQSTIFNSSFPKIALDNVSYASPSQTWFT